MTKPPGDHPGKHTRISREELDRLFDRELSGTERRDLVGRLGRDPSALDEVSDVRRMVNTMRTGADSTPDLTGAVMDRLDRSTGFLSPRLRRRVKVARLAAAACLILGLLGVTLMQRAAPDRFRTIERATPVADLTEAVRQDSAEGRQRFSDAVCSLAAASPAPAFVRSKDHAPEIGTAPSGHHSVSSQIGTPAPRDLTEPVPPRYFTLTASSDAEVLALTTGDAPGLTILAHFDATGLYTASGFAPARLAVADHPIGAPLPRTEIREGIVPLSFGAAASGVKSRAAYVGKRSILPPVILHDTE